MDLELNGKTAVITGGSAGIGLAIAKALFREGVKVVLAAHTMVDEAVQAVREMSSGDEVGVSGIEVDLMEAGQAQAVADHALKQFKRINILVNCAGAAKAGSFLELTDDEFLDAWKLKLLGYIRMVRSVLPQMMSQRDGCIVNIIGAAGRTPVPTFLAGSTANAALINFTRGLSKEIAKHNIRIIAVSPTAAETERANRLAEQTAQAQGISVEEVKAETASSIPLGRMIKPTEIADLVAFLVSDRAAAVTGAEILIDGGQTPGI
jgi:3-oxoacyl-[acyl-carrier protein] reductase/bacilysin biosynthesis oxidoreductase BacG